MEEKLEDRTSGSQLAGRDPAGTEDTRAEDAGTDQVTVFAAEFLASARALFAAAGVEETIARVVEMAVEAIEGCDVAGLLLLEGDALSTPVHSDRAVADLDDLQRLSGEGPCVDAIAERRIVYVADLAEVANGSSWSLFARQATGEGLRSALALPLTTNGIVGSLNLYGRYPVAFGVLDRAKAVLLATLAGLALVSAHAHEDEVNLNAHLHDALSTREVIGQAQGILMERERITADHAFDILRRASQNLNRKLRDVARDLVETGVRPLTDDQTVSRPARAAPRSHA